MPQRIVALAAVLGGGMPAMADTLVVCIQGNPDFLNAAMSTANTSFDVT